jgi:hypothetical protein
LPLLEAIDFGHAHPCVVWAQLLPYGALQLLGGGDGPVALHRDFAPWSCSFAQWFPTAKDVWTCWRPGRRASDQPGLAENGVRVLQDHGIFPRYHTNAAAGGAGLRD